ncbi:MAG: restriction endonuclease [Candidatus Methanoplasma sp.]|nr:restriction endonuclease [Candidatus Methanoplasma sp.]
MRQYYLEGMDGYEFEDMCAEILRHRYQCDCDVTSRANDGGKDIIVRAMPPIYVECKHFGEAKAGRPIIQKLHSAMETAGARGMVIAPSGFSSQAASYIKENGYDITLVDFELLKSWASDAGISVKYQRPVVSEYDVYAPAAPAESIPDAIRKKTRGDAAFEVEVLESKKEISYARLFSITIDKKFFTNDGSGVTHHVSVSKQAMSPDMYGGPLARVGREPGERPAEEIADLKREEACMASASIPYINPATGAKRTLKCPVGEKDVDVEYLGRVRFESETATVKVGESVLSARSDCSGVKIDGIGSGFLCASCGKYSSEAGACKKCGRRVCRSCVVKKGLFKWECKRCSG